jgi:hypothetical protein
MRSIPETTTAGSTWATTGSLSSEILDSVSGDSVSAMSAGTNMSRFALGDRVDMHCGFHDRRWNLASLNGDYAELTLEG